MFLLTNLTLAGGFWVSETCFFFSLALRLEGDSSLYLTWQIFIFSLIYLALNQDVFSFFIFVFGRKEGRKEERRESNRNADRRQREMTKDKKKKRLHCLTSVVPFITSSILIIIILSEGKSLSTSACTLAGKATLWLLKVSQKTFILIWATEHADQTLIKPVDTLGEKVCLCMNNIFVI